MNILKYELKKTIISVVIWTVTIIAIFLSFMEGVFPIFEDNIQSILKMLEGFPKNFSSAFGFDITTILSYEGFFSFSYGYISLLGCMMAVILALSVFSKEKRNKCMDFLFTKPLKRSKIFILKLLAVLIGIVILNIIYVLCVVSYLNINTTAGNGVIILSSLGLLFTQLVFVSIGIIISVFTKKVRSISGIGTAVGFGAYILSAVANIVDDKWFDLIAPLKYFDPLAVFQEGHYEIQYVVISALIIIVGGGMSFVSYCKKDIHAV